MSTEEVAAHTIFCSHNYTSYTKKNKEMNYHNVQSILGHMHRVPNNYRGNKALVGRKNEMML